MVNVSNVLMENICQKTVVYVKCNICGSRYHCSAMHDNDRNKRSQNHGGERSTSEKPDSQHTETTARVSAAYTKNLW